jgi:hypothetical protein
MRTVDAQALAQVIIEKKLTNYELVKVLAEALIEFTQRLDDMSASCEAWKTEAKNLQKACYELEDRLYELER